MIRADIIYFMFIETKTFEGFFSSDTTVKRQPLEGGFFWTSIWNVQECKFIDIEIVSGLLEFGIQGSEHQQLICVGFLLGNDRHTLK